MRLQIEFTPKTTAKYPALRGWRAGLSSQLIESFAPHVAVGDMLQMEGVPVPTELRVFMRLWTLMSDDITLLLVLQDPTETTPG